MKLTIWRARSPAAHAAQEPVGIDELAAKIASELARLDGFDPSDEHCGLYDLKWQGNPPEPMGDLFHLDYLPKGEAIAKAIGLPAIALREPSEDECLKIFNACDTKKSGRAVSVHIYSPRGYYLAQIKPHGCRKWRTIKSACGDRKFRSVSKAVIAAAKNMKKGLRARVIFCADWHEPMVAWEAKWT